MCVCISPLGIRTEHTRARESYCVGDDSTTASAFLGPPFNNTILSSCFCCSSSRPFLFDSWRRVTRNSRLSYAFTQTPNFTSTAGLSIWEKTWFNSKLFKLYRQGLCHDVISHLLFHRQMNWSAFRNELKFFFRLSCRQPVAYCWGNINEDLLLRTEYKLFTRSTLKNLIGGWISSLKITLYLTENEKVRTKNWCWCRATGSWKATANGWREVCRAGVFFPEKEGPDIAMPLCKSRVQRWEHHWKPRVLYVSTHQSGSSKEERESLVRAFFFEGKNHYLSEG